MLAKRELFNRHVSDATNDSASIARSAKSVTVTTAPLSGAIPRRGNASTVAPQAHDRQLADRENPLLVLLMLVGYDNRLAHCYRGQSGNTTVTKGFISLRGVEVHNLKGVDLDIPHRKLVVFCGLSGSGKTSLALDTLYAEGQRRYIETFSAYTRQFLQRLERPAAEQITGIPPAVAVTHKSSNRSNRSTVGTVTETNDYLRLLWPKSAVSFARPVDMK